MTENRVNLVNTLSIILMYSIIQVPVLPVFHCTLIVKNGKDSFLTFWEKKGEF